MERGELSEYLRHDLYRYGGARARCYLLKALFPGSPGFTYTYFLRLAAAHSRRSFKGIFYRVILQHYGYKYGFQIPPNTRIGKGLYINHFGPVVINGRAEIGDNCTLGNVVTIGQMNRGPREGCPKIGSGVFIGAGAVVVGKIVIGDNVLVAPNAYVNFDVPGDSMVIGNPAVVKRHANPTAGYVCNVLASATTG